MTDDLENLFEDGEDTAPAAPAVPAPEDKRVSDLMSKWQKAEARAKKLEEQVAAQGRSPAPAASSGVDPWLLAARDAVIDKVYEADPRYERYGIRRDFFVATDPSVTKGAAAELSALLDGIEARAREDAAAGVGYVPELGGGSASREPIDFDTMKKEDFEALVAKAKMGR